MDVIFEVEYEDPFGMEVGFFDTVREIKEKIEEYRGLPTCKQTLIFDGLILEDEYAVNKYNIVTGSRIRLVAASEPPKRISLIIRTPRARMGYPIEVYVTDTVKHLKELLASAESVDTSQLALFSAASMVELEDHCLISEYGLEEQPNVDILIKPLPKASPPLPPPPPPPVPPCVPSSSSSIMVKVLPWEGRTTIAVEVEPSKNVGSLRTALEKMQAHLGHGLPPEGYFFIHNQCVMDESLTFESYLVKTGDTIEVFRGRVTKDHSLHPAMSTRRFGTF